MRLSVRAALAILAVAVASGHVGTYDVVHDGMAGPYPVRVVVRPAGVVPGRAMLTVRVLAGAVRAVQVQAAPASLGVGAAPRAEVMQPVPGDAGLYVADVWLMTAGVYAIRVHMDGSAGPGDVVVPVTSVATRRLGMDRATGVALAVLLVLLAAGALTIVRAAVRDAVMPPGVEPGEVERRRGRVALVVAACLLALVLGGGWRWWRTEDRAHARTLERPMAVTARVARESNGDRLRLDVTDPRWAAFADELVPDHGRIMHLFLVRAGTLDALAHLHPVRVAATTFSTPLAPIPAGQYFMFADVVNGHGETRTLAARVEVPEGLVGETVDRDDSWSVAEPIAAAPIAEGPLTTVLAGGGSMTWERAGAPVAGPETTIRVRVRDARGAPAALEPYLEMPGHAVVMRDDGSVFAHLHPGGTISMAAQERVAANGAVGSRADVHQETARVGEEGVVRFPFAFPRAGRYRVWVQVRVGGVVRTGVFDTRVAERTPG